MHHCYPACEIYASDNEGEKRQEKWSKDMDFKAKHISLYTFFCFLKKKKKRKKRKSPKPN